MNTYASDHKEKISLNRRSSLKKLSSLLLSLTILLSLATPALADQVWGDAVDATASNHDQAIDLTVKAGQSWSTPLGIYINNQGQEVTFPVDGTASADAPVDLSRNSWRVSSYDIPDQIIASKLENTAGLFEYTVTFAATTDLDALSKSFDQVKIRVTVQPAGPVVEDPPKDTTAPSIQAPAAIVKEATAILTPVSLGTASSDDPEAVITNNAPSAFAIGLTVVTWKATDAAGNFSTASQNVTIVDTTAPVLTVPANKIVITAGALTAVDLGSATATDIFPTTVTSNAPPAFPLGTTKVLWTATDANGNVSTGEQSVTVKYDFGGILQPINTDGSSIFKLGSTIPVKFQLKDASGSLVSTAVATLSYAKFSNAILGNELEAASTSAATTGSLFRYDAVSGQYIFNLSTKGLQTGSYQLTIKLDDGLSYTVKISLK